MSTRLHKLMISLDRLAFIDLETSGLSPTENRITEIGVITVDTSGVKEWSTLIHPGERLSERSRLFNDIGDNAVAAAPRFKNIAADLFARLSGYLFIAHNARFDFSFLRAEFQRVGIEFCPPVLCSVMLSRKLYPASIGHDLDTLMQRHGLKADMRHRALPDARLIWQFWQVIQSEHDPEHIETAIAALLAGPVLPPHLDPSLIERLPETPGVFVLHGKDSVVLHAGKAGNLKLHLQNYFRIDRTSDKALAVSHQVNNITWRTTRGTIGAQLQLKALSISLTAAQKRRSLRALYSWQLIPDAYPCLVPIRLSDRFGDNECYGIYSSELKARNALVRVATNSNLCHALLGIGESSAFRCTGCIVKGKANCGMKSTRIKQLTKAVLALGPLRVEKWPFDGPIGLKERSDLHIVEDWRYLGTAQSDEEIHHILECRRNEFDEDTFVFLSKTLSRLPRRRIVRLASRSNSNQEQFHVD